MNLQEALQPVRSVQGVTSIIAGVLSGDFGAINDPEALTDGLAQARNALARVTQAQDKATSDASWWGYNGQRSYWEAVVDILEAAELVGEANLPDIEPPVTKGKVVMDAQYAISAYGKAIKQAALDEDGQTGASE